MLSSLFLPLTGEPLPPAGIELPAHGAPIPGERRGCGNSLLAPLLRRGLAAAVLESDRRSRETPGTWLTDDLRTTGCGCSEASRARTAEAGRTGSWSRGEGDDFPSGSARPGVGSSSEDSSRALLSCAADAAQIVEPDDIPLLAGRSWINLGAFAGGPDLRLCVPGAFLPSTVSKGDMKRAYIPEWLDRCAPAGLSDWSMASACIHWVSRDQPGLFWDKGHGYWHAALMHAILTLYGYRSEATEWSRVADTCHMDEEWIRRKVERGDKWVRSASPTFLTADACADVPKSRITVDATGLLTAARARGPYVAWAYLKVRLCAEQLKIHAALADYYFYWAHRLYAWSVEGYGDASHRDAGQLCAKAALAEIVELAALVLHEAGHLSGSYFHCNPRTAPEVAPGLSADDVADASEVGIAILAGALAAALGFGLPGWLVALATWFGLDLADPSDTEDPPQDCCQYGLEYHFRPRVQAALGLPPSLLEDVDTGPRAETRFDSVAGTSRPFDYRGDLSCSALILSGEIHEYLSMESGGEFQWAIPADCINHSPGAGFESW